MSEEQGKEEIVWTVTDETDVVGDPVYEATVGGTRYQKWPNGTLRAMDDKGIWRTVVCPWHTENTFLPAMQDLHSYPDGSSKWMTHEFKDRGDSLPFVPDLADEIGRKEWGEYRFDPRTKMEGPVIRTREDLRSYLRLTGRRIAERGETFSRPCEAIERRQRELLRENPWLKAWDR